MLPLFNGVATMLHPARSLLDPFIKQEDFHE